MAASTIDLPAIIAAGFAALGRDDPHAARALFGQAIAANPADAAVWFGLSRVHRSMGEPAEEHAALDRALTLDSHHVPALVAKGDWFVTQGDRRAGNSYYTVALRSAASMRSVPLDWRADLRRIEEASQRLSGEYRAHLLDALAAVGFGGAGSRRFAHAIDLLLGKKQIYSQQPKYFYFPELPQIQFFERAEFPWVGALEQEFPHIQAEVRAVMRSGAGVVPYIRRSADRPAVDDFGLLENLDWSAFFLIQDGVPVPANASRCPRTLAALRDVPLCRIDARTPSVLFSILRPGARIRPHHGFMNARLICHLPLIVPAGCGLRVGNDTRAWREGEVLVFDDTIEHEAWNSSQEPRAVLIFDVWRPELSDTERALVTTMLQAIDGFDGPRRTWTD